MSATNDGHRPERRSSLRVWSMIVGLVIVLAPIAFVVLNRLPYAPTARTNWNWQACTSNLKQIGQAMLLYANENGGAMTPDFARLIETQDLVPEVFVCRSTNDEKSDAATQPAQLRADLARGAGHCSYVFVDGHERYDGLPADDVVAFEPPGHHGGLSAVLFADGRVERVKDAVVAELLREFDQGVRPIRFTTAAAR